MHKYIKVYIIFCTLMASIHANNVKTFVGEIQLPMRNSHDFCIYYNGCSVQVKKSSYIFSAFDDRLVNILITDAKNIIPVEDDNKLITLTLKRNCCYEYYELVKTFCANKSGCYTWTISKKVFIEDESDNNLVIPLHTILIPLDVETVNVELENIQWKEKNKKNKLPIIKLSPKDEESDLEEQLLRSCLALVDFKSFHGEQKAKKVEADNLTVQALVNL